MHTCVRTHPVRSMHTSRHTQLQARTPRLRHARPRKARTPNPRRALPPEARAPACTPILRPAHAPAPISPSAGSTWPPGKRLVARAGAHLHRHLGPRCPGAGRPLPVARAAVAQAGSGRQPQLQQELSFCSGRVRGRLPQRDKARRGRLGTAGVADSPTPEVTCLGRGAVGPAAPAPPRPLALLRLSPPSPAPAPSPAAAPHPAPSRRAPSPSSGSLHPTRPFVLVTPLRIPPAGAPSQAGAQGPLGELSPAAVLVVPCWGVGLAAAAVVCWGTRRRCPVRG